MFKSKLVLAALFCSILVQPLAFADYSFTTITPNNNFNPYYNPYNNGYNPYYRYNYANANSNTAATTDTSTNSTVYPYNNFVQYPNQNGYVNPYYYRNGYWGRPFQNVGTVNDSVKSQILRNVGQNMIYSMMNRY